MAIKQLFSRNKKIILILIASGILFLSVAHHAAKFWEKPALKMLSLFIIFVPFLAWGLFLLIKQAKPQFVQMGRNRLFILMISTLLISSAITWRYYHAPTTYHLVTITPVVSQNQKVELIEIKANGNIIPPNEKKALEYGWQMIDDVLVATSQSQPLTVSFKAAINSPVTLLFYASPQSGNVIISLGNEQSAIDLKSSENRQRTSTLYTHSYRGIPNWIFIPFLIAADIFTFGSLILVIFILQEAGQNILTRTGSSKEHFVSHRAGLVVLLIISSVLHLFNALSVPLLLDVDSPSHLMGAIHLLEFGNLDGVSMVRGPGSAFLFAPFLFLFGRNPWGIKILLHLIAIACVPISYRIGWQLGKNQWVALASGLATIVSPDLFLYSNYLMSDLPNIFFVLVFCTFMISALETFEFRWIIAATLIGTFATLFRSENITLLVIGAGAFLAYIIRQWQTGSPKNLTRNFSTVALALIIAAVPILWWSGHNQRVHGFFGLSNYAGEVFYDGWVYFGEASGLSFTDQNSQAIQQIASAIEKYPIIATDQSGAPTGWELYPSLMRAGYTTEQAFNLLENAARDSINKNKSIALKLLFIKIRDGLTPGTTNMLTLPLPWEDFQTPKMGYFDQENLSIPLLINLQREFNKYLQKWYDSIFPYWVYLCLFAMTFSLYRSPKIIWITLILITATRIFIPNIMGLSHWRYTLAGLIPLQIITVNWMATLGYAVSSFFKQNHNALEAQKIWQIDK